MGCGSSAPVLQPFPPLTATQAHSRFPSRTPLRVAVVANPFSGGGEGRRKSQLVQEKLTELHHNVEVHLTAYAGHAVEIAATLPGTVDVVVAVGGDGTSHEVVNGLIYGSLFGPSGDALPAEEARPLPPVLLVPCGTGNTAAFSLGIRDLDDSLRAFEAGRVFCTDLLECTRPDDTGVPRLAQPPAGELTRVSDAAASAATAALAAPAPAAAAAPRRITPHGLANAKHRVVYSFNMLGYGLSVAVLSTANAMRWAGAGAGYNLAALRHVVANRSWVACLQFVDPPMPVAISGEDYSSARRLLSAMEGAHKERKVPGYTTGSLSAEQAAADAAAMLPRPAAGGGGASGVAAGAVAGTAAGAAGIGGVPAAEIAAAAHELEIADAIAAAKNPSAAAAAAGGAGAGRRPSERLLPLPTPPPSGEAVPFVMLHMQPVSSMGSKIIFAPFARADDGMMDIVAVKHVSRSACINIMDTAKLSGRHVLGPPDAALREGETPGPLPGILYAQAREVILRPLTATETARWSAGYSCEPASDGSPATAAAAVAVAGGVVAEGVVLEPAPVVAAGGPEAVPIRMVAPADDAAKARLTKERGGYNPAPEGMIGPNTLNVDGEVSGFSPVRVKVLPRVLPLLINPVFVM